MQTKSRGNIRHLDQHAEPSLPPGRLGMAELAMALGYLVDAVLMDRMDEPARSTYIALALITEDELDAYAVCTLPSVPRRHRNG